MNHNKKQLDVFAAPTRRVAPKSASSFKAVAAADRRLGAYDLHFELGRGGMGTVYLGIGPRHADFRRPVAIKELDPMLAGLPSGRAMFRDEIALAAQLSSHALPRLLDTGRDGDRLFMVTEYAAGEPLSRLRDAMRQRRRVPHRAAIVAKVIADICDAVHSLHEATSCTGEPLCVIHRDLSPDNLMLTYDGHVRVLDLGIARWAKRTVATEPGFFKGKVTYSPPEVLLGASPHRAADVWSLGLVLWELLAERPVFDHGAHDQRSFIDSSDLDAPSGLTGDVPTMLDAVIARAMAHRPEERYETAEQMAQAIRRAADRSSFPVVTSDMVHELIDSYFPRGREAHAGRLREVLAEDGRRARGTQPPPPPAPRSEPPAFMLPPATDPVTNPAHVSSRAPANPTVPPTAPVKRRSRTVWRFSAMSAAVLAVLAVLWFTSQPVDTRRAPMTSSMTTAAATAPGTAAGAQAPTPMAAAPAAAAMTTDPVGDALETTALDETKDDEPAADDAAAARAQARSEARRERRRRRAEARDEKASPTVPSDERAGHGVVIVTSDEPASVFVGGKLLGTTPTRLDLARGQRVIEVQPTDGSARQRVAVNVDPGRARLVEIKRAD